MDTVFFCLNMLISLIFWGFSIYQIIIYSKNGEYINAFQIVFYIIYLVLQSIGFIKFMSIQNIRHVLKENIEKKLLLIIMEKHIMKNLDRMDFMIKQIIDKKCNIFINLDLIIL